MSLRNLSVYSSRNSSEVNAPLADNREVRSSMASSNDFFDLICFVSWSRAVIAEPLYLPSLVAIKNQLKAFAKLKSFEKEAFMTKIGIKAFNDGRRSLESTPYSTRFFMTVDIASLVLRQCSSN